MTAVEVTRHIVSIAGRVADTVSGAALPGAVVSIVDGPTLARTHSRADGYYWFLDLPPGVYQLEGAIPRLGSRYGTGRTGTVRVWDTRDPDGRIRLEPADIALPPTRIHGRVTRQADSSPVPSARVRLRGDTAADVTAADGRYAIEGLVAGSPTVEVAAPAVVTALVHVNLTAGQDKVVDIALVQAT
jgi:hypothetical protein